ncbi:DNA-processing protein DprA [bacterium]|nr:DNA-processing protein DprA [bacterium]
MKSDSFDHFRVSLLPGVGPRRGRSLLRYFSTFTYLLSATEEDLCQVEGFSRQMSRNIRAALQAEKRHGDIARLTENNAVKAERKQIRYLSCEDPGYPQRLLSIYDPPLYLFMKGRIQEEDDPAVAVVGTRNPSDYGRRCTEEYCRAFAAVGITIVSGLAMGIDTVAHRCALRFGTRTIAVLGSGLLRIYPGTNHELAEAAAEHGALLSELPLEAKPDAQNFPRRNRIISGLAQSLVVMESAVSGGAMISASIALDQNRDVFAVPGPVHNAMSAGPHKLIRKSMAQLAASPEDILAELHPLAASAPAPPPLQLSLLEQQIVDAIGQETVHVDELSARTGMPLPSLLSELLQMEFRGAVRQLPGKYFICETSQRN